MNVAFCFVSLSLLKGLDACLVDGGGSGSCQAYSRKPYFSALLFVNFDAIIVINCDLIRAVLYLIRAVLYLILSCS